MGYPFPQSNVVMSKYFSLSGRGGGGGLGYPFPQSNVVMSKYFSLSGRGGGGGWDTLSHKVM